MRLAVFRCKELRQSVSHYALAGLQPEGLSQEADPPPRLWQSLKDREGDRFYRVNSDRSRHTDGSGLGLAIAAAIAQAHHVSIQVHRELGGSTFTIRFTLR